MGETKMNLSLKYEPKDGTIVVPGSKAEMHRALIVSALAGKGSEIHHGIWNDDTLATKECLEHLGAQFREEENTIVVEKGIDLNLHEVLEVSCRDSASTFRFLFPLVCALSKKSIFHGSKQLFSRPFTVYEELLKAQGLTFEKTKEKITVFGTLQHGSFSIDGFISSQFLSGLLFALPILGKDSEIILTTELSSKPYVDITMNYLKDARITFQQTEHGYHILGNQSYQKNVYEIPGDDSLASNFAVLSAITKQSILIENILSSSRQADYRIFSLLVSLGIEIEEKVNGILITGKEYDGFSFDLWDCPDLGPILFVLASQAKGPSTFKNYERLRYKESDRLQAMKEELEKVGCLLEEQDHLLVVSPMKEKREGECFNGHHDHRIIMALTILSSLLEGSSTITTCENVQKSYPTFFEEIQKIGYQVENSSCIG